MVEARVEGSDLLSGLRFSSSLFFIRYSVPEHDNLHTPVRATSWYSDDVLGVWLVSDLSAAVPSLCKGGLGGFGVRARCSGFYAFDSFRVCIPNAYCMDGCKLGLKHVRANDSGYAALRGIAYLQFQLPTAW